MNDFREEWLKERDQEDLKLFEKIKHNPSPEIADLWALSEDRFIEWRKLNDFPKLLRHFSENFLLFEEWKSDNNLTDEIIISTGEITPFIEEKKLAEKNKSLYLTRQTWADEERIFVAYEKMVGDRKHYETVYKYEFIQVFTPYLDWLKKRGKYQEILYINHRSAPNHRTERVWIHAKSNSQGRDFELLKMGGISLPVSALGILIRGKKIEFANLCGLRFTGDISFGEEGNLSCSYCACDNWTAENLEMPLLDLDHCSVKNFTINNSKIQQWRFYDCKTTGDFTNSKLYSIKIYGGSFNPVIQNCTLSETDLIVDPNIANVNLIACKAFKKIYQAQGDDDIARDYFIMENEFVRKHLKGWNFFTKSLSYYYWQYGNKPHRIIYYSIGIIVLFGFIYWFNEESISVNTTHKGFNIGDSLYFSVITFTTLGYGDFSPVGWLKILSAFEAFSGVVNMGFLVAGYSNNKY